MDKEMIQNVMSHFYEAAADWKCTGIQTEHNSDLTLEEYTVVNERGLVKGIVEDIGEEFLQWLYDTGYFSDYLYRSTQWKAIMHKFCLDTGLIRTTKCYKCKAQATEVSTGKFHCDKCGHVFDANLCPECGKEMDYQEPKEGEPFTPYYMCPGHFHTAAPG